jgi:hypothetical protein
VQGNVNNMKELNSMNSMEWGYLAHEKGWNLQKSKIEFRKLVENQSSGKLCPHCHMDTAIRNLSGYCDHLYYPAYCKVCKTREGEVEL